MNLSVSRELKQSKFFREQSAVCMVCILHLSMTVDAWMRVKAVYTILMDSGFIL